MCAHAGNVLGRGLDAVVPFGTTGEGASVRHRRKRGRHSGADEVRRAGRSHHRRRHGDVGRRRRPVHRQGARMGMRRRAGAAAVLLSRHVRERGRSLVHAGDRTPRLARPRHHSLSYPVRDRRGRRTGCRRRVTAAVRQGHRRGQGFLGRSSDHGIPPWRWVRCRSWSDTRAISRP